MGKTTRATTGVTTQYGTYDGRSVSYKSPHNRGWRASSDKHDHHAKRKSTRDSIAQGQYDVAKLHRTHKEHKDINPYQTQPFYGFWNQQKVVQAEIKQRHRRRVVGAFRGHRLSKVFEQCHLEQHEKERNTSMLILSKGDHGENTRTSVINQLVGRVNEQPACKRCARSSYCGNKLEHCLPCCSHHKQHILKVLMQPPFASEQRCRGIDSEAFLQNSAWIALATAQARAQPQEAAQQPSFGENSLAAALPAAPLLSRSSTATSWVVIEDEP